MFFKLRSRRANKEKNSKGSIFKSRGRKNKTESSAPEIGQVLTMTLSEDASDTCGEVHDIADVQPHGISFTQQQVMENALKQMRQQQEIQEANQQVTKLTAEHKQQLAEKQQQVAQLKKELSQKSHLYQELKRTHSLKMTAKQEEIVKMKNVLRELKQTYEQKLSAKQAELETVKAESEEKLAEKETELVGVKEELKDTKKELSNVGSVLIQCQHKLHEQQNKFFFWS